MKKYYPKRIVTYLIRCAIYFTIFCGLCLSSTNKIESAEIVDRIVAVVNDDIITLFDLNHLLKPYVEKIEQANYPEDTAQEMLYKVRENALNRLIEKKLTDQEIKRTKMTIGEKEIDDRIEQIKKTNFYTDEGLRKELEKDGLSMEEYRQQIKDQILRIKLINYEVKSKIVITTEDIKSYYENHQSKYAGKEKYHLRNIIMKVPPFADNDDKLEIKSKMDAVLARLNAGESFETLAMIYSESSLAAEGGDLGLFDLDSLSPQLKAAINGMQAGEFTPVIDTDLGYQIFLVQDVVKTQGKSLEDASSEIEKILFTEVINKKFETWVDDLRKQAHIKIIR
ncbi:MAG: SurA N-terminal domain-containing protein [Desulfobacterales bacterium]|nr:MAG: SurA N-terminal domain-containing protein [Desulfobacterales bacterium]